MSQQNPPVEKNRSKFRVLAIAAVVVIAAVIVAASLFSPLARYRSAGKMLAQGEYAEALETFKALGSYKDAAILAEKAETGLVYLEAQALLEQGKHHEALALFETAEDFGDSRAKIAEIKYFIALKLAEQGERKEARALLEEIAYHSDAAALLKLLKGYDQGWAYMVTGRYDKAAEEFRALGDFLDAAEQAEECLRLVEVKSVYVDGRLLFQNGDWLGAYQTLSSIREDEYEDTLTMLEEIATVTEEKIHFYAAQGDRGKLMAFLRLMDEIDAKAAAALRQELTPEETITEDWSYFNFDPKCLTACSSDTQPEEYAATILYMILNGQTELTLHSASDLDKLNALMNFYTGQNVLSDITPGYGQVCKVDVKVQDRSVQITLRYKDSYSEEQFCQIIETYETFCVESLHELVAAGLLSPSMSHKQKAMLISEWVGFYLSYDQLKDIYLAGVAIEEGKGVCSAYVSIYHRMCNLAGIPTYGQTGNATSYNSSGPHIWVIHVDEAGDIFYADPTWADPWDIDFSKGDERATVAQFVDQYLDRCMEEGVREYKHPDVSGQSDTRYFWSGTVWSSHEADRTAEQILATHQTFQGLTP